MFLSAKSKVIGIVFTSVYILMTNTGHIIKRTSVVEDSSLAHGLASERQLVVS